MLRDTSYHRTAGEWPAMAHGENPKQSLIPEERHVPHKFCVVLLKGAQTRWFRDEESFLTAIDRMGRAPRIILIWSAELGRYCPEVVIP